MSNKLKKHKHTGSFGPRYGLKTRKIYNAIETTQRQEHTCPNCGFARVKRYEAGIYQCRKCDLKFAGGAFLPKTLVGQTVSRIVKQNLALADAETQLNLESEELIENIEAEEELEQKAEEREEAEESLEEEESEELEGSREETETEADEESEELESEEERE